MVPAHGMCLENCHLVDHVNTILYAQLNHVKNPIETDARPSALRVGGRWLTRVGLDSEESMPDSRSSQEDLIDWISRTGWLSSVSRRHGGIINFEFSILNFSHPSHGTEGAEIEN